MKKLISVLLVVVLVLTMGPSLESFAADQEGLSETEFVSGNESGLEYDITENDISDNDTSENDISENDISDNDIEYEEEPEQEGYIVTFAEFDGGSYVAYDRQNLETAVVTENAAFVIARDSDTGEVDISGNGQANFSVVINPGYKFDGLEVTEGTENYKNLKTVSETDNVFTYRITKITGDITVSVKATKLNSEAEREVLIEELGRAVSSCPKYYSIYCTAETAAALTSALEAAETADINVVSDNEIALLNVIKKYF